MSRPARLVVGVVLVAVGLVALGAGFQGTRATIDPTARAFINDDRPGINAHNSPSAAADPANPDVIAVGDRIDSPDIGCAVSLSVNRGVTWDLVDPPLAPGVDNCFWPEVAFGPGQELLVLATAMGGRFTQPLGVWLHRRQGLTESAPPVQVVGPNAFHASLAVEGDRVVVVYIQARPEVAERGIGFPPPPNPLMAVVSTDGGRTFGAPVPIGEPDLLVAEPRVLTAPDGLVVVSALDLGQDAENYQGLHQGQAGPVPDGLWRVLSWTSRDGGAGFGPTSVVTDALVIPQRVYVDIGTARPGLARDAGSGRLYSTWESGPGPRRDVFFSTSDDDGGTWREPRPLAVLPGTQTLPTVSVAPGGRVDVVFYDRSNDRTDENTEVVLASSWDGGETFSQGIVSARRFDSRIGFGAFQGLPSLGTHLAVVSQAGRAAVFWSDTRRGTIDDGIQDLALALVDVQEPGRTRWGLVGLGLLLMVPGALLLLAALRAPRAPPARR